MLGGITVASLRHRDGIAVATLWQRGGNALSRLRCVGIPQVTLWHRCGVVAMR